MKQPMEINPDVVMRFVETADDKDVRVFSAKLMNLLTPKQIERVTEWFEVTVRLKPEPQPTRGRLRQARPAQEETDEEDFEPEEEQNEESLDFGGDFQFVNAGQGGKQ